MFASPDVVVAGGGIIGLTAACAIAKRGITVSIVSDERDGEASGAAAGMLAPSVERAEGPAHEFAIAARDRYPGYIEELAEQTGIRVPLNRLGILQVALNEAGVKGLRRSASQTAKWIERAQLAEAEPTLGHAIGAVLNPEDGAVDNVTLIRAVSALVDSTPAISRVSDTVASIDSSNSRVRVQLASGKSIDTGRVVVAGGAWASLIEGVPLLADVTPSRGQLVAYDFIGLRHVVYGPRGYLVPRGTTATIAGSTMENVGFDSRTTDEGVARVRSAAEEIAPALSVVRVQRAWAGLRPVTPDLLPLLGPDPRRPTVIYSCGHSRNGILLAPLSADVVSSFVSGESPRHDVSQFRPERFQGRFT